jgi:hypothetical protein
VDDANRVPELSRCSRIAARRRFTSETSAARSIFSKSSSISMSLLIIMRSQQNNTNVNLFFRYLNLHFQMLTFIAMNRSTVQIYISRINFMA